MLIFDQFKKGDAHLRLLSLIVLAGFGLLFVALWWVQIVSSRDYQANLEMQSFRTVRIPAVRAKILDRNGNVLAENRPSYNISLYLEELRKSFDAAGSKAVARARTERMQQIEAQEKSLKRGLTRTERKKFAISAKERDWLREKARFEVASNVVMLVSQRLRQPLWLNPTNFERHYKTSLALPCPVMTNLNALQIALFEEQFTSPAGVDIEMDSTRIYPFQTTASHLLGYIHRDDSSVEGEESFFSYRLPDYKGQLGIEAGYDKELRGKAGAKSVLVNSLGYRQTENIWTAAQPGSNVVLTLDLELQQATERALQQSSPTPTAAAVVMDVQSGDILALASIPKYNPNYFIQSFPPGEYQKLNDANLKPLINRATQGRYMPGSIFKTVVGLAALESGLDHEAMYHVEANPKHPSRGCIFLGKHKEQIVEDQVAPGEYNFRKALKLSSNAYFIAAGLRAGIESIFRLGQRLHLGELIGLPTRQETAGAFPTHQRTSSGWVDRATANVCIGQDPVYVTPLQMTVLAAAIANGGNVLFPRLVDRIESQDPAAGHQAIVFPSGRVRDHLGVSQRNLAILQEAMLADVEDSDGTGRQAAVPGLRICGKTGTAQVKDSQGKLKRHDVWFLSFAPYQNPRYAVVVMVEGGSSGGGDCAPIAGHIYTAIRERERKIGQKPASLANAK